MGDSPRSRRLTHISDSGSAKMVDVTKKPVTVRQAEARGRVSMRPETLRAIQEQSTAKGDVLGVARVAGIMAGKKTSDLIPLCHNISVQSIEVDLLPETSESSVEIIARATSEGKTGVEMEALTAVAVAGLAIYDMCKAIDRGIVIGEIRLTYKSGGKSGEFRAE